MENLYVQTIENIIEESKKFEEIDPQIHQMFMSCLGTFNQAVKEIYVNKDNLQDDDIKIKIFEGMFNINLEEELLKMVEGILQRDNSEESINNEKNVDEELLKNIKKNIQNYLKD